MSDMSEAPLFWRDVTAENDFFPAHGVDSSADFLPDRRATPGDYKMHRFSYWDQVLCLAFAQLTHRESLRDIEVCLRSRSSQLSPRDSRPVSRSTLAHANEHRPWQMYADLAEHLIGKTRRLYAGDGFGVELDQTVCVTGAEQVKFSQR